MTTPLRARLRYPIGSRWKYDAPAAWGAGHKQFAGNPVVVEKHEYDEHGGVKAIGVRISGGFQWWAAETCNECLEPEH